MKKTSEIVVASDIHVAKVWDDLSRYTSNQSLNPNSEFRSLINSLSDQQILVINGDLVDYYYANYYPDGEKSNFLLFYDILTRCKSKCFLNLGNHDYRAQAYNFNIYKLRHVAVSDKVLKKISGKLGFSKFRWLKELYSIRVNTKWIDTTSAVNQIFPYSHKNGNQQLVFIDTGPDALTNMGNLFDFRKWNQLFTKHPSSQGISDDSMKFLIKKLASKSITETIIFLHCPPFFSTKEITPFKISKDTYQRLLKKHKLMFGTFLKNNYEFLNAIFKCSHNVILIVSHVHIPKQYIIDKESRILKDSTIDQINQNRTNPKIIKIISTLPLGAIGRGNSKIGVLNIGELIDYRVIKDFNR